MRNGSYHCGWEIYRAAAGDLGDDYNVVFVQAEEKQRRFAE
jgi:hypothetical protein